MTIEKVSCLPWWIEARKRKWLEPKCKLKLSILEKISFPEFQQRINFYPLTLELVADFLQHYVDHDHYYYTNGYFLMRRSNFQEQEKFTIGIKENEESDEEKRTGIIHECCHGIYLVYGIGAGNFGTEDQQKIEELIEEESKRFVKKYPFVHSRQLFFDFFKQM